MRLRRGAPRGVPAGSSHRPISKVLVVIALLAGITTGQLSGQLPAAAVDCSGSNHCYATARWAVSSPSGFRGAKVLLRTNCMATPSASSNIVVNTLWVGKGSEWIEAGITIGTFTDADSGSTYTLNNPARYIARYNNGVYAEHFRGYYTTNTGMYSTIRAGDNEGTNDWQAWFDNASRDTFHNVFTVPASRITTGTELTNDGAHTYGSTAAMYYYNLGGALVPEWQGASSSSVINTVDPGMFAYWVDNDWWLRDGRGAAC